MLSRLYDIIFGQDEFDKIKIDVRFELISEVINKIFINQLEDFEILEACIYKIKDQLRVKSSNLNRIIRDPAKKLTKKQVIYILEKLDKIKYDFLEEAFIAMGKNFPKEKTIEEKLEKTLQFNKNFKENSFNNSEQENQQKNLNNNLSETLEYISNNLSSNFCDINLKKGKIPYILMKFKEEVDFSYISKLTSLFFESLQLDGTNIIIEGLRVLIIPRFINDNLFDLPKINSDLDKIYNILIQKNQIKENTEKNNKNEQLNFDYLELNNKKQEFKSNIKEENSLDSIINGIVHKKNEIHPPIREEKKQKDENLIYEKDDLIEFEKKSKEELDKENKKEEIFIEKTAFQNREKHIIYSDDVIEAKLVENSKSVGEVVLKLISNKPLEQANQNELTYIILFSKVFSSVIFDSLQVHGTNILWDYSKSQIKIVPRYQNDNLNLTWKSNENSDELNDQIKEKLISRMLKEVEEKEEKPISIPQEKSQSKEEIGKKAKLLLDSIRKIP